MNQRIMINITNGSVIAQACQIVSNSYSLASSLMNTKYVILSLIVLSALILRISSCKPLEILTAKKFTEYE